MSMTKLWNFQSISIIVCLTPISDCTATLTFSSICSSVSKAYCSASSSYRQAQRHRWRFPCYLIAFSSQRVGRNVPGFEALKAITSSIKHLCATGVASIVGVAIFYEPIVYKHKRGDLSINKFSLRNFVKLKVAFSN